MIRFKLYRWFHVRKGWRSFKRSDTYVLLHGKDMKEFADSLFKDGFVEEFM